MMRNPAPRSLPELTRCTLLSSTLIDWLRLRSTKSSTKSAPERSARLITLSTRDCSRRGIRLSLAGLSLPSAVILPRMRGTAGWGRSGWGVRLGFADPHDHPQPEQRQHPRRGDENRGIAEAGRQRRPEQRPNRVADRGRAAGQAIGRAAKLGRSRETDDGVGRRDQHTEEDAEPGAQQQKLADVLHEGLRQKEEGGTEARKDEDAPVARAVNEAAIEERGQRAEDGRRPERQAGIELDRVGRRRETLDEQGQDGKDDGRAQLHEEQRHHQRHQDRRAKSDGHRLEETPPLNSTRGG